MKVNVMSAMVFGALALAASSAAMAQDATTPAPVPAATPVDPATTPPPMATAAGSSTTGASASKMRVGVTLVPMPLGSFKTGPASLDSAVAFGVMPVFDYLVLPNVFVGVAPSYTFNVKPKDAMGDAASQLDLLLRVGYGMPVGEKLGVYGYASPGYSIVSPPEGDSAKGLVVGLHVGAMYDVASNLFLNGQVGYQLGFQKLSGVESKTNFLQIGLGVGMRL